MAFNPVDSDSALDLFGEKPWCNDYFAQSPKKLEGSIHPVIAIKASTKGYVLATEEFLCWIWKKSTPGITLAKALTDAISSELYPSPAVQLKGKLKDKFILGFDDETLAEYELDDKNVYSIEPQDSQLSLENAPSDSQSKGK